MRGLWLPERLLHFPFRLFFSHCALRCMTIINCQTKLLLFGLDPVHSMQSCYSAGLLFLHQSAARVPPSMPFSVAHEDWFRPPDFGEQAFQRKKGTGRNVKPLFRALILFIDKSLSCDKNQIFFGCYGANCQYKVWSVPNLARACFSLCFRYDSMLPQERSIVPQLRSVAQNYSSKKTNYISCERTSLRNNGKTNIREHRYCPSGSGITCTFLACIQSGAFLYRPSN